MGNFAENLNLGNRFRPPLHKLACFVLYLKIINTLRDMWRWGLSKSPAWDCGWDQQTANHIIIECPLYRPPKGLHGLFDVDADAATREWLPSKLPQI